MNRWLAAAALVIGLFGPVVGPARAEVTAEQVRKAIDRGVSYLLGQQRTMAAGPTWSGNRAASAPCVRWRC